MYTSCKIYRYRIRNIRHTTYSIPIRSLITSRLHSIYVIVTPSFSFYNILDVYQLYLR